MTAIEIADLSLSVFLCLLLGSLVIILFKKWPLRIILLAEIVAIPLLFFFNLTISAEIVTGMFVISSVIGLVVNSAEIRGMAANPISSTKAQAIRKNNKEIDRFKLNKSITTAVKWLSDNRVGGLITFERNVPLDKYVSSGTILNAPITPELIETIFYEGTRLHDGAIIIRGNTILAAAVFFPPTNKPLVGKFGARHRAAIGISELTDSVTIIVSEETGRISIAYGGDLESVKYDEFEKVFSTFLLTPTGTTTFSGLKKN